MLRMFHYDDEKSLREFVAGWGDKERDQEVDVLEYGPVRGENREVVACVDVDRRRVFIPPSPRWEGVHAETIFENLGLPVNRVR